MKKSEKCEFGDLTLPAEQGIRPVLYLPQRGDRHIPTADQKSLMRSVMYRWLCVALFLGLYVSARGQQQGTYGQQVVAAVLMAEAWGEGKAAMTAVGEVIRLRADEWDMSPLAVVKRVKHFSCLNRTRPEALVRKFHREPDFRLALKIARTLYNTPQNLPGLARGATHFHDHSKTPYWANGQQPVAVIGKLSFYRLRI